MMKRTKKLWLFLMAAVLAIGSTGAAWADDKEKITDVTLKFSGTEPESGEEIGDIHVEADGSQFRVEYAEYTNSSDYWVVGDEPEVLVELSARDGYKFSYTSKSHFHLSGMNVSFEKAKIYDDGAYIEVTATLKRVGGKLPAPENLEWSGNRAVWDAVEGAKSYEVNLRRDDRTVTTVETTSESYDFSGSMTTRGDYTFRVRAVADYNNRAGEWSDYADEIYISEQQAQSSGSGRWIQDQTGWWYMYSTGGYPADCWKLIDGSWYYFKSDGYISLGWLWKDGSWYYLHPTGGYMLTGWQYINDRWYYLNSSGVMLTGWQYINGRWYYMDSSGAMYANTWTPDGYYVDGSGARVS